MSGSTELWYDDTEGVFRYHWKTARGDTGCVRLVVTTSDSSELTALFRLR